MNAYKAAAAGMQARLAVAICSDTTMATRVSPAITSGRSPGGPVNAHARFNQRYMPRSHPERRAFERGLQLMRPGLGTNRSQSPSGLNPVKVSETVQEGNPAAVLLGAAGRVRTRSARWSSCEGQKPASRPPGVHTGEEPEG